VFLINIFGNCQKQSISASIWGGPVMAIIKWDEENQAYFCKWTEGSNKKFEDYFDEEMAVFLQLIGLDKLLVNRIGTFCALVGGTKCACAKL
jgi:uncharacterized protein YodC (DUF2158 family)